MDLTSLVKEHFQQNLEANQKSAELLPKLVAKSAEIIFNALVNDRKILSCGNGGSAADAQHFAAELIGRFEKERISLPAIALTTDTSIITAVGNDYSFEQIFSKQIKAIGKNGDILLAISTSGNSNNVIEAIHVAHEKELIVIALTGYDGGRIKEILNDNDIILNIPYKRTSRIQEMHILLIHALCDCIDQMLFGE